MNSEAGAVNNFRTDVCYLSPRAVEEAALHALLDELVARHQPDLIIPTRDDDVVALARWAQGRSTAPSHGRQRCDGRSHPRQVDEP